MRITIRVIEDLLLKVLKILYFMKDILTAGSAKKDIPSRAQKDAITLPCQVSGTISP